MTERWPHCGRSGPGPPSSAQLLRWHSGWKKSNKLIEPGSWVLSSGYAFKGSWPPCQSLVIHPTHAAHTPPGMAGEPESFFGLSATIASVVTRRPATELASCKATLTTLAGSMMPFPIRSPYSPVWASKPKDGDLWSVTLPTTIEPSTPAFSAIWRIGACSARRMMLIAGLLVFIVAFDLQRLRRP